MYSKAVTTSGPVSVVVVRGVSCSGVHPLQAARGIPWFGFVGATAVL